MRSKVRCNGGQRLGGCSRCTSRGVSCTYQGTSNDQNVASPALDGAHVIQTASLQHSSVDFVASQVLPHDIRPGLDSHFHGTEDTCESSNSLLTDFVWDDNIFAPERPYVPDSTTDPGLNRSEFSGSHLNPSNTGSDLQSPSDMVLFSEQPLYPSFSIPVS